MYPGITDGITIVLKCGKTRGRPPWSKFIEIRVTRVFLRYQPWKRFQMILENRMAEPASRVIIWNLRQECSSNPKSSNGARNSRSIAILCSNLRRKKEEGFSIRFDTKDPSPPIRTCSMLRDYVTRKGKGGKAPCQQKSTSIRDVRWIIAFRIGRSASKVECIASMQLSSTSESTSDRLSGNYPSRRTDFKFNLFLCYWNIILKFDTLYLPLILR